jgi:hypothetical protein
VTQYVSLSIEAPIILSFIFLRSWFRRNKREERWVMADIQDVSHAWYTECESWLIYRMWVMADIQGVSLGDIQDVSHDWHTRYTKYIRI